ncbi:hypothetical protein HYC85_013795 [Camellia sinensis]|uniref:2-oxoglutarate dehydrogenase E1 component/KDG C-terminal domain-containing protein n=1 Tax=Camellia sinensis TaxID=4442 RepID=A0A7J7H7W3_CAMSI|nr:hypothetical protein HYC85_013795 [Camellia sinensis]
MQTELNKSWGHVTNLHKILWQMSDDNPYIILEMDPTLGKQIQECNWQIVNVTTPANYFHVLRRQVIVQEFRKPLIVMSPKNLLRHKDCKPNLSEFDDSECHPGFDKQGTKFKRLIKDQNSHSDLEEGIRRLVLCSGKVYYELDEERKKVSGKDIAICRVEQLCPFPYDLIQRELKRYPNPPTNSTTRKVPRKDWWGHNRHSNIDPKFNSSFLSSAVVLPKSCDAEIVWCQEEPMNMGVYHYITLRLSTAMKALGGGGTDDIKYVGRAPSAATATGFYQNHAKEQTELIQRAMQSEPINYPF